jgi:hypothetical protein
VRRARRRTWKLAGVAATLLAAALAGPAPAANAAPTLDPNGPQGMDLTGAFTLSQGAPSSVIAYVEGGINWHGSDVATLAAHGYVNWHEVPVPCPPGGAACVTRFSADPADYDPAHTGVINAAQWTGDPRVHDANGNGVLDPEDLIAAFADGTDQDGNGFTDDIAGWDFYDRQPDPATVDSSYGHANGQMSTALQMCPKCLIMPVKAGAEALDDTDLLAQAWLYAAQMHVTVITSVTADLGYSSFMRQAIDRIAAQGIAMVESSNDFDSIDHQGGMFHPDVVPGNGALADPTGTHWIRANETSWGPHNMFSIAGQGSTSASTAATGGLFGLLMAWGQQEAAAGRIPAPLTGRQAVQVMRATATPITDTTLPWPGAPGDWSLQYGYGIPNLAKAMRLVDARAVPPVAVITSPDWYTMTDPATGAAVPVSATVDAPAGSAWSYQLQLGLGGQPADFRTIATGEGSGAWSGTVGTVNPADIPQAFSSAPVAVSTTKELPTAEQFDVTLRLVVTDRAGAAGVDRRVFYAHHDPDLAAGFPQRLDSSAESQPALADLNGDGRLDIVFGTADGVVHAIDPVTHRDLPGWPAQTDPVALAHPVPGIDPGHESILAGVAVGDLDRDGTSDVVVTSLAGHVYVVDSAGHRRPGWPKTLDTGVSAPPIPRPAMPFTRLPHTGAVAAPVLVDLRHNGTLDIVAAGWDGHLHAWDARGADLPGWPVHVTLPSTVDTPPGYQNVHDQKLDATPAVAYLDGPANPPSLVERVQYSQTKDAGVQALGFGFVTAYNADGSLRPGWPVRLPSLIEYYGSAQEFVTEGTSSAVSADTTGLGLLPDRVAVSSVFSLPFLIDGGGHVVGGYGAVAPGLSQLFEPDGLQRLLSGQFGPDLGITFATSGAFGRLGGQLMFGQATSGALSLLGAELNNNSGTGIREYDTAYPALGGVGAPGFPASRQGLDFLGAPSFADVDGAGPGDMLDGGDSNLLHAYTATGAQAPGFPKFTSGWSVFSPVTGDLTGDGHTDLVTTTREGYLLAWSTPGHPAGNAEWWRWAHDEYNSGHYGTQSRPPGAVRNLAWRPGQLSASFTAPGSTWYDGVPAAYVLKLRGFFGTREITLPSFGPAGTTQHLLVPPGTTGISVQARNWAGLTGMAATAGLAR